LTLLQSPVPLLIVAAVLAATGQVLFKLGTVGVAAAPMALVNPTIAIGLVCYGLGTLLWLMALSRTTLMVAYPFTALTFVLVYGAAVFILHEKLTITGAVGSGLVWAGLAVLLWSQASSA
jgi:undecaprenyl phosphate-alpha-L-ara4N flippase subunit ArnE